MPPFEHEDKGGRSSAQAEILTQGNEKDAEAVEVDAAAERVNNYRGGQNPPTIEDPLRTLVAQAGSRSRAWIVAGSIHFHYSKAFRLAPSLHPETRLSAAYNLRVATKNNGLVGTAGWTDLD